MIRRHSRGRFRHAALAVEPRRLPKQLLPLAGGQTLLQIAYDRLKAVVPANHRCVCAGETHRSLIRCSLGLSDTQYLGEPMGRDTVNALGSALPSSPSAIPTPSWGVCTSDHIIEPVDKFRELFEPGFALAEQHPNALITFDITPTAASTAYGYLQLGASVSGIARVAEKFRERPECPHGGTIFHRRSGKISLEQRYVHLACGNLSGLPQAL